MSILVDSYSEENTDYDWWISTSWNIDQVGQTFTGDGNYLESCKFNLKKYGLPTGDLTAYVYNHTGTWGSTGVPTGDPIATSGTYNIADLTTSYQLITFTFTGANQVLLENGVHYAVVVGYDGGDTTNYLIMGFDNTSPTHDGNGCQRLNSTEVWEEITEGKDFSFYVYGESGLSPGVSDTITLSESKNIYITPAPLLVASQPGIQVVNSPKIYTP